MRPSLSNFKSVKNNLIKNGQFLLLRNNYATKWLPGGGTWSFFRIQLTRFLFLLFVLCKRALRGNYLEELLENVTLTNSFKTLLIKKKKTFIKLIEWIQKWFWVSKIYIDFLKIISNGHSKFETGYHDFSFMYIHANTWDCRVLAAIFDRYSHTRLHNPRKQQRLSTWNYLHLF